MTPTQMTALYRAVEAYPQVPAPRDLGPVLVRCAEPACGALLTVDDAHDTLGCWTDDVYCGDHLDEHIGGCGACQAEERRCADRR